MNHAENLAAFLRSKGIYDSFCEALERRRGCSFKQRMGQVSFMIDIINTSITWNHTSQGQEYWSTIHKEWKIAFVNKVNFLTGCRSIW